VTFYLNKWGNKELQELPFQESLKILEEEKYWNSPAINELCIKIGNTEKGKIFYNEELVGNIM
jgi:hypothetical protein